MACSLGELGEIILVTVPPFFTISIKNGIFRYCHNPNHYNICIDKEDPATVYVALKNKLMNSYNKDWSLLDASRLLKRFLDALDDDLAVVFDYISKIKAMLDDKKDDADFTRLQAFYLLSMCLSKPHQLVFDHQMRTLKEANKCSYMDEPFSAKTKKTLIEAQKKYLTGMDKLIPYGDLSNKQKGIVKLYATKAIKPEAKKPTDAKPKSKANQNNDKPQNQKPKKPKNDKDKDKEETPRRKRFRRTKIPDKEKEAVVEAFEKQKDG